MTYPIRALALLPLLTMASGCFFVVDDDDAIVIGAYDPCDDDFDCPNRTPECVEISVASGSRVVTDTMCTRPCGDDFDCPFGGACYALEDRGPSVCYERCDDDFDCPVGWACLETVGGRAFDAICLPS